MEKIWENKNTIADTFWVDDNGTGHVADGVKDMSYAFFNCKEQGDFVKGDLPQFRNLGEQV